MGTTRRTDHAQSNVLTKRLRLQRSVLGSYAALHININIYIPKDNNLCVHPCLFNNIISVRYRLLYRTSGTAAPLKGKTDLATLRWSETQTISGARSSHL